MPIVRISSRPALVGSSRPDNRIGTAGAATSAMPTAARSHPIVSQLVTGTVAAYTRA
jgi:hypothetical protein